MKEEIKILIDKKQFREAFDFASRQPDTVTIRESFVLIANEASRDEKFSSEEKECILNLVVKLIVFRQDFKRAKAVLLLFGSLDRIPRWLRNLTGL